MAVQILGQKFLQILKNPARLHFGRHGIKMTNPFRHFSPFRNNESAFNVLSSYFSAAAFFHKLHLARIKYENKNSILHDNDHFKIIHPSRRHNLPPTLEIIIGNFRKKIQNFPKFSKMSPKF